MTGLLLVDPVPQDPLYHLFADMRDCFGIRNIGDVSSNLGFGIVGLLGLWTTLGPQRRRIFDNPADAWPYIAFFLGVGLISAGSAYYHAAPDNARLFWDRLPMTVAFMAFFAGILSDRVAEGENQRRLVLYLLLPVLMLLGVLSLLYWVWSENNGTGDLRFYALVQFYPMLSLPLILWLFPKSSYTGHGYLLWIVAWYALAKVFETLDAEIFDLLGRTISGHSLKHLISAVATFVVWRMLIRRLRASVVTKTGVR